MTRIAVEHLQLTEDEASTEPVYELIPWCLKRSRSHATICKSIDCEAFVSASRVLSGERLRSQLLPAGESNALVISGISQLRALKFIDQGAASVS